MGRRPTAPAPSSIVTTDGNPRQEGRTSWSGASSSVVDVYRNGQLRKSTRNDGKYVRTYRIRARRTFTYRLCEAGSSRCSNTVTVSFR